MGHMSTLIRNMDPCMGEPKARHLCFDCLCLQLKEMGSGFKEGVWGLGFGFRV